MTTITLHPEIPNKKITTRKTITLNIENSYDHNANVNA